jgi:uncharacterized protein
MKVMLEAAHPAHVHFLTPIGHELIARGNEAVLAIRCKDVAKDLAEQSGLRTLEPSFPTSRGRGNSLGLFAQVREFTRRTIWLHALIRREGCDLVVTRNPTGIIAATLARVPSIFDTDDGRAAGIHFRIAWLFATIITTPHLLPDELGDRQRRYGGLKSTVFLNPDRFVVRGTVLAEYGIDDDVLLVVARFSANDASHDRGIRIVPKELVDRITERIARNAHVVVSREGLSTVLYRRVAEDEGGGTPRLEGIDGQHVDPNDFLHLLASADLHVGDSGSVTMEAAALGVPTLRIADTRRAIITELGKRYGLVEDHPLAGSAAFLSQLDKWLEDPVTLRSRARAGHVQLLSDSEDVVVWFGSLCEQVVQQPIGK